MELSFPKPVQAQQWQWRRLCCIPNFLIALFMFGCILGGLALLFVAGAADSSLNAEEPSIIRSILIALACFIALILVSNLYTWVQVVGALIISHQRRIAHSLMHLESTQTMNYIASLKTEVDTIVQMVQCLDAFVGQQTRLVVIVDGLDSCEQEKVLHVLDAVHLLFSDTSAPFLTVLAIDPHIVILAIESNINRAFHNSSISGHEYLRNVVHLPFYLQNSGLRRVKTAQQAALFASKKATSYWNEDRECDRAAASVPTNRKASNASMSNPDNYHKRSTKGNQKLKTSESMASSISNLHRVVLGAQDLTKILLTDDYFSDVNPRSMRRLMNIVYVTGRLLKAFNIDFNWYHLASWVNITEQWPYRTSWIIMYYEMHETEMDEGTSLKSVYEKIRCCMPTSKDDDSMLDLDHDERKFEVFLSVHSCNLLINDLKIFLPFTINLDPYIRKIVQEEHQLASEILKTDLKPSNSKSEPSRDASKWLTVHSEHQMQAKNLFSPPKAPTNFTSWLPSAPLMLSENVKKNYSCAMTSPVAHHIMSSPNPVTSMAPWWSGGSEQLVPYSVLPMSNRSDLALYSKEIKTEKKLSLLSVDDVISLLPTLQKLDKQKLASYSSTLKEHNINGQVLLTCDLDGLKNVLNMSFGDWELFRVLIITLREQEFAAPPENQNSPTHVSSPLSALSHNTFHRTSLAVTDSPDIKRKEPSGCSRNRSDSTDSRSFQRGRSNSSILEKQVTMEESMIVGALETLNEEALEDALEEQRILHADSNAATISSGAPSNPLSPILSDPEEQNAIEKPCSSLVVNPLCSGAALNGPSDIDVMYIRTARDSPMLYVSALSLTDSITDMETSSITQSQHFQPVLECRSSPASLARTASNEYSDSLSAASSPSRQSLPDKPVIKVPTQRPSSLIYENSANASKAIMVENESTALVKSKPPQSFRKIPEKISQEKNKIIRRPSKGGNSKKQEIEEKWQESSSDSSTETENVITVKKTLSSPKVTSPQSEADFYSDDEHTPLVSPFPSRSSHYNLQAAQKHEKDGSGEKLMPKHATSEPSSSCLKLRKPLERQFSIDSYLCDKMKLASSDAAMVEIPDSPPHSGMYGSRNMQVYGQNVVDTPSPESKIISPVLPDSSLSGAHTETVL